MSPLGSLNFSFPLSNWEHTTYELAVRPTPVQPGDYDLFFNIGSPANQSSTDLQVALSGLATGSLNDDSIYKITVHDTGGTPQFSNLTQIATGLHNAAGMAFSSNNRDFYFQDNGISVVGISSLEYFWQERTPEETSAAVRRLIEAYGERWKPSRVVLAGCRLLFWPD